MWRTLKRLIGREELPSPERVSTVQNSQLLEAIRARNQSGSPESFKSFYDAFHTSTLLVALPMGYEELVETFVDRLRQPGEKIVIEGISEEAGQRVWGIFTDEIALRRWSQIAFPYVLVPASDILWTAQKNRMTLVINPGNSAEIRTSLDSEEIAHLSEGRYPPAARSDGFVSGTGIRVLPLDETIEEAARDSIARAFVTEPAISRAYVFKAHFGYQTETLLLGLEFDPEVNQEIRNEVCKRVSSSNRIWFREGQEIGCMSLWKEILEAVTEKGIKVYERTRSAPRGFFELPEGHEIRIVQPSPGAGIWGTDSGVWIVDFGPKTLDDPPFFEDLKAFFNREVASSVLWVLQGSAISNFPMEPAQLQRWFNQLYHLVRLRMPDGEERSHAFIVKAESEAQRIMAYLLLALGRALYRMEPGGGVFVEVYSPQGITIGVPGPVCKPLLPEQCFILIANEEKAHLAALSGIGLADVERQEYKLIAEVLEMPPELQWEGESTLKGEIHAQTPP